MNEDGQVVEGEWDDWKCKGKATWPDGRDYEGELYGLSPRLREDETPRRESGGRAVGGGQTQEDVRQTP